MAILLILRNLGPSYFLQGKFWNPEIPFSDKWQHANRNEYLHIINRWNPRPYQKASQHKVIEKAILTLMNVPTPRFIGFLHEQCGVTSTGNALKSLQDFQNLCLGLIDITICLKPVEGFGGSGFRVFKIRASNVGLIFEHPFTLDVLTPNELWRQIQQYPDGYIIEHYLYQHPLISNLHPQSVNTIRIWVYKLPKDVEIACAFLRVGCKGSIVDNTSSGGLYCPVDLETGELQYGGIAKEPWVHLTEHPDTGSTISGVKLPFWTECQEVARQALLAFPHVRIAGVDVAIGVDGPKMIELNVQADQIGPTRLNVPLKRIDRKLAEAYGQK